MTWPIAIFACFCVLVLSLFGFLLVIYFKEFGREEKLLKQFAKAKKMEEMMPLYIMPVAPSKKTTTTAPKEDKFVIKSEKNKKDIN